LSWICGPRYGSNSAGGNDDEGPCRIAVARENIFARGAIGEMRPGELDAEAGRDRIAPVSKGAQSLLETTKPVVVAVDGCAYGAGCSLALAADFVVATERARFCMSFLRLGLIPDACGLFTLPRVVGWLRAKDMLYSTRAVGGSEALEYGMVNELAAPEALQARAREIALAMTNLPRTLLPCEDAMLRSMSSDLEHGDTEMRASHSELTAYNETPTSACGRVPVSLLMAGEELR